MEQQHKHALKRNKSFIVSQLRVDEEFLAASEEFFTRMIIENIKIKPTNPERASKYVDQLLKRRAGTFELFIEALFQTRQGHIAANLGFPCPDHLQPLAARTPDTESAMDPVSDEDSGPRAMAPIPAPAGAVANDFQQLRVTFEDRSGRRVDVGSSEGSGAGASGGGSVADEQQEEPLPKVWPPRRRGPVRIEVRPVDPRKVRLIKRKLLQDIQNGHAYDLMLDKARYRGRAIIVHNFEFNAQAKTKGLDNRAGSELDEQALTKLFEGLNFECRHIRNRTGQEMQTQLEAEAKDRHLREIPMLFVVVMSHGNRNVIYGSDGAEVSHEVIVNTFDSRNCRALKARPKVFLLQACQGEKVAKAPGSGDQSTAHSSLHSDVDVERDEELTSGAEGGRITRDPGGAEVPQDEFYPCRVEQHEDMLLVKASLFGYASVRDVNRGTWFIQAFVEVVSTRAHQLDFPTLLTRVKHLVGRAENNQGFVQTTNSWSTLQKDLYLYPGL